MRLLFRCDAAFEVLGNHVPPHFDLLASYHVSSCPSAYPYHIPHRFSICTPTCLIYLVYIPNLTFSRPYFTTLYVRRYYVQRCWLGSKASAIHNGPVTATPTLDENMDEYLQNNGGSSSRSNCNEGVSKGLTGHHAFTSPLPLSSSPSS